jgi:DNA gyrase subunit A
VDNDEVVSLDVVKSDCDLLVLHERGWGKRVLLDEYSSKGRYTQGNWTTDHRRLEEIGPIVAARVVHPNDEITVITTNGLLLRTTVREISRMGRSTRGVRIVNLQNGDTVAALAVITYEDLRREMDGSTDEGNGAVNGGMVGESLVGDAGESPGGMADDIPEVDVQEVDVPEVDMPWASDAD